MQAPLLAKYPANLSVTAYSYLFGVLFMVATAVLTNNELTNWSLTRSDVWAVLYAVSIFSYTIVLVATFQLETCLSLLAKYL